MLRGSALADCRRFDEAIEMFAVASVGLEPSPSAAFAADLNVASTPLYFGLADLPMVKWAADRALRRIVETDKPDLYFVPLVHSRGRALNVHGVVSAACEDYHTQLAFVRRAVQELLGSADADLWLTSSAMKQLAVHVRDFDLPGDAETLRSWLERNDLPSDLSPMRFEMHRALGWSSALRGDHLGAFRDFRLMGSYATTAPYQILASVERAFLMRELGESHSAREQIEYAATLADRVDWNAVGEERIGLAQLAQEVAAFAPARARVLLDRYLAIKVALPPGVLNATDRRARAFEDLAEGTVLQANGQADAAQVALLRAFTVWNAIGYSWRAATAAIPLFELTAAPKFAKYVCDEVGRRPNSWLEKRARLMFPSLA